MRATLLFFLYLLACLGLGAVVAVPLVDTGWLHYPPERILGRLAQIFMLLGFWPFLKAMGLADSAALGYGVGRRRLLVAVGLGWILGVGILLVPVAALVWLGVRVPDPAPWAALPLLGKILGALAAGFSIGVIEETFFRGALFVAIRRRDGMWAAVLWSAALYALVHVLKPGALPPGVRFDAAGAWAMVYGVFADLPQWRHLDTLTALFGVGVFLAMVRERTGHIGWCIGLHAGWVWAIQVTRRVSDSRPDAPLSFLAGDYDGVIGWLVLAWIALLTWLYWRVGGVGRFGPGTARGPVSG